MSNCHSLSTYVDRTNFKKLFSETIGTFLFFVPACFLCFFFHWNSLGPIEILYGLGGTKMSVFLSLCNLLFNRIPFHKNWFLHKIDSVISTLKELTISNHFSSSLNLICTRIYSFSKSEMSKNHYVLQLAMAERYTILVIHCSCVYFIASNRNVNEFICNSLWHHVLTNENHIIQVV